MSKIPYLTKAWNPVTGCTPVDASETGPCRYCWAKATAERFPKIHGIIKTDRGDGFDSVNPTPFSRVTLHPVRLQEPLHWRKPQVVGVSFMGDIAHEQVPFQFIADVFEMVRQTPQHIYLFLTKRISRLADFFSDCYTVEIPDNAWIGYSAWNQESFDRGGYMLRERIKANHKWCSLEPLLGPVDGEQHIIPQDLKDMYGYEPHLGLNWIVAGCESRGNRVGRPAPWEWFGNLRLQCVNAGVPFYCKQASSYRDGTGKLIKSKPESHELPPAIWRVLKGAR